MSTTTSITTAAQLLAARHVGRCELVRGELTMMSPAGFEHGRVVSRINTSVDTFVRLHDLGVVTGAETGFWITRNPDTVRAPDVGFVRKARIIGKVPGFFPGPPDLAIEVLSPNDSLGEVLAKVRDWLESGTIAVWVIDPEQETATAYHLEAGTVTGSVVDVLAEPELLPGFALNVAEVFEP